MRARLCLIEAHLPGAFLHLTPWSPSNVILMPAGCCACCVTRLLSSSSLRPLQKHKLKADKVVLQELESQAAEATLPGMQQCDAAMLAKIKASALAAIDALLMTDAPLLHPPGLVATAALRSACKARSAPLRDPCMQRRGSESWLYTCQRPLADSAWPAGCPSVPACVLQSWPLMLHCQARPLRSRPSPE